MHNYEIANRLNYKYFTKVIHLQQGIIWHQEDGAYTQLVMTTEKCKERELHLVLLESVTSMALGAKGSSAEPRAK